MLSLSLVFALWLILNSAASGQQRANQSAKPLPLIQFTDIAPRSQFLYQTNNSYTGRKYFPQPMCGGVAIFDYDGDGRMDIFFTNGAHLPELKKTDASFHNALLRNHGDNTFEDVTIKAGLNGAELDYSFGVDFRDFDGDGRPDIFETAMYGDTFPLYRNNGGKQFDDVTTAARLYTSTARQTAWSNGIFDFDNDGWKDLFTANGAILDNSEEIDQLPYKLSNSVLRNNGDGTFTDASAQAGSDFTASAAAHRGAAFGDFDNDGRIDVVTNNLNAKPELFFNRSPRSNHWLLIKLIGTKSNRDGLGAKIKVTTATGRTLYNHATTSVGYGSSSDARVHFGIGASEAAERIEINWPSGLARTLTRVKADQILTVRETEEKQVSP